MLSFTKGAPTHSQTESKPGSLSWSRNFTKRRPWFETCPRSKQRIVRFSCPGHNEFATRAPGEINRVPVGLFLEPGLAGIRENVPQALAGLNLYEEARLKPNLVIC